MKERPIIFSGESVRAILDGRKTMTRRVCKIQPIPFENSWHLEIKGISHVYHSTRDVTANYDLHLRCPYGKPGDRLYVKESAGYYQDDQSQPLAYRADVADDQAGLCKWRGPYFLKRSDSRITLEITGVRVERLQAIDREGSIAEGVARSNYTDLPEGRIVESIERTTFAFLWDKINGKKHPWASDPWVWVIEFKKI